MERIKDEALRVCAVAEQKFLQHDLTGAKQFALRAQNLFPNLDGLPQLITALDVHLAAQEKFDGLEKDWYGILQTNANADEASVRKQYRKLALTLHPDKNKAVGAEGAFKLISDAWCVLSDKEKKAVYDAKMTATSRLGSTASQPLQNFAHFRRWCRPNPSDVKSSFSITCPSCRKEFVYLRIHGIKKLSCPTCHTSFLAPEAGGMAGSPSNRQRTSYEGSGFVFHWGKQRDASIKHTQVAARAPAEIVHETYEAVRRERVKAQEEVRQKAAKERMEVEIEERGRVHRDRKRKRGLRQTDRSSKVVPNGRGRNEQVEQYGLVPDIHMKAAGTDAINCVPSKQAEAGKSVWQDPGLGMGESYLKWNQACNPAVCRTHNICDKSKSYDSSDSFSILKRVKVDV